MALKYSCGTLVPSSCVPFTGKDLKFLSTEDQPSCDANIDEVIDLISIAIDDLQDVTDVSDHDLGCLSVVGEITLKKLDQAQTDKICELATELETLTEQFNDLNIANELITINLGCLASAAAPCQVATNTYTLISILNTFRAAICEIKTELGI